MSASDIPEERGTESDRPSSNTVADVSDNKIEEIGRSAKENIQNDTDSETGQAKQNQQNTYRFDGTHEEKIKEEESRNKN